MNGIAVKLKAGKVNNEYVSAAHIASLHEATLREKGKCYFSTKLQMKPERAPFIDTLLIFNKDENIYYLCSVEQVRVGVLVGAFLPDDAAAFSPAPYAVEPSTTWFLLTSMQRVDKDALSGLHVTGKTGVSFIEMIDKSSRFPRFYFEG